MVAFTLSMPGVGSWDGKWSRQDECHVIVRSLTVSEAVHALNNHQSGYHHYAFGDGWAAGVSVREVDRSEARKLRRKSDGFCGYDWMVDSILKHGKIQCRKVTP